MKRLVVLVALGAFALAPTAVSAKSDGFYGIGASTKYCLGAASCDLWTGPAPQVTAFVSVFDAAHRGRVAPPDSISLGCFVAYSDISGLRHYQYALANSMSDGTIHGSAGIMTSGDTSLSTAARSFVNVEVVDTTDGTVGDAKGIMTTDNTTKTLVSGGIVVSITGELSNWHVGVGPDGEPFLFPDPATFGTIMCNADTNGIDPSFTQFFGIFPF